MTAIIFIIAALVLIASAAICSSKMDTVDDHWSVSKYSTDSLKYPEKWFNSNVSWNTYKSYITYRALADSFLPFYIRWASKKPGKDFIKDFWHWEKAKMIASIILSGLCFFIAGFTIELPIEAAEWISLGLGPVCLVVWYLTFEYYYNRKLVRKGSKKRWLWLKADTSV